MPAYAYPIKIEQEKQFILEQEVVEIDSDTLTLEDLRFVGTDEFCINEHSNMFDRGYTITVTRRRLETDAERDARVARQEAYMAEYHRRHPK